MVAYNWRSVGQRKAITDQTNKLESKVNETTADDFACWIDVDHTAGAPRRQHPHPRTCSW